MQQTLASFLISEHISGAARGAGGRGPGPRGGPPPAPAPRRLSLALEGVAAQLDPAPCRPSFSRD